MLVIETRPEVPTAEWIVAGNATFTVEVGSAYLEKNPACKPHYTYRVRHKEASKNYAEAWFVTILIGQDNQEDYAYLGLLERERGLLTLTRASRCGEGTYPVVILRRVLKAIWEGREKDIRLAGWDVHHEGCCGRCGRTLTVPESIRTGFGPECSKIVESGWKKF